MRLWHERALSLDAKQFVISGYGMHRCRKRRKLPANQVVEWSRRGLGDAKRVTDQVARDQNPPASFRETRRSGKGSRIGEGDGECRMTKE